MQCDSTAAASLTATGTANAVEAVSQQPQRSLYYRSELQDAAAAAATATTEDRCPGKRVPCSSSAATFPLADHCDDWSPHRSAKVSMSVGMPTTNAPTAMPANGPIATGEQRFGQHGTLEATASTAAADDLSGDQYTPLLSNATASSTFARCASRHLRDVARLDHMSQDFHSRRTFPLPRSQHSMTSPPPRRCRTELANGGYPSLDAMPSAVMPSASTTRSSSTFMLSGFHASGTPSNDVGTCRRVVLPISGAHVTTASVLNELPSSAEFVERDDGNAKSTAPSASGSSCSNSKKCAAAAPASPATSSVSFRPPAYSCGAAINKRNNNKNNISNSGLSSAAALTSNGGTAMPPRRQPRKSNVSYSSTASVFDANGATTTIRESDGYSGGSGGGAGGRWEAGSERVTRNGNGSGNGPPLPSSSSTLLQQQQQQQQQQQDQDQPFDLENVLLLQRPILPPNSHFFCCFYKFHITAVAKVLSVIYAFLYGFLCLFSYKSEHAPAFLITVLVTVSVAGSTLYAAFKWSKMCLIPFFLLQVMLVFYTMVCLAFLLYARIIGSSSYYYAAFNFMDGALQLSTSAWITIFLLFLIALLLFLCYSALLFWYEYQFIAEVDRFLKSIRKSSSQGSKDDQNQNFGTNVAF